MKMIIKLILSIVLVLPPLPGHCQGSDQDTVQNQKMMLTSDHNVVLMPGVTSMDKPVDMLKRKCMDCHLGDMNIAMYLMVINDTIKSKDKMTNAWLTLTIIDSLKEIFIKAEGINSYRDTLPIKKALVLVTVNRYFGWMPVHSQLYLTNDSGITTFSFPEGIRGDTTGALKLLIKLFDTRRYPNAKIRINKRWGVPASNIYFSSTINRYMKDSHLFRWISIIYFLGTVIICILLISTFRLILKIRKAGN